MKEDTIGEATLGGNKYIKKSNPNNAKSSKTKEQINKSMSDSYGKVADAKGHDRKRQLQKGHAAFKVGLAKKYAKKETINEISKATAERAYAKARDKGQHLDSIAIAGHQLGKDNSFSKKFRSKAEKKWSQARKFADYAAKKMEESKSDSWEKTDDKAPGVKKLKNGTYWAKSQSGTMKIFKSEKAAIQHSKKQLDEVSTKKAQEYVQKNSDQRWKEKLTNGKTKKRLAGSNLAKRKLLGVAKVATTEEILDESKKGAYRAGYDAWSHHLTKDQKHRPTNPYKPGKGMGEWERGAADAYDKHSNERMTDKKHLDEVSYQKARNAYDKAKKQGKHEKAAKFKKYSEKKDELQARYDDLEYKGD